MTIKYDKILDDLRELDDKAKASATDTTPGYLSDKLLAGANVYITPGSVGGNETLTIASTGGGGGGTLVSTNYTGADLTGSSGDTNRTLVKADAQIIIVDRNTLQLTVDYTISGTTITFLGKIWDDQNVTVWAGSGTSSSNITGADLTGSSGDTDRTTVFANPTIVVLDRQTLHYTVDYTVSGTTITFTSKIWDDQNITLWSW